MVSQTEPQVRQPAGRRPRVLLLTARGWYRHLSHTIVLDFEDAMADVADVTWAELPADAMSDGWATRLDVSDADREPYDLAFFVAMAPSWLRALRGVRGLKQAARTFAVYVFDAWPYQLRSLRRWRRQVTWIDHLFVAYPEAVDVYAPYMPCPVHYLVQGTSATRFRPDRADRPIDFLSVGRRHQPTHDRLVQAAQDHDWLYVFADRREPVTTSLADSRYLSAALSRAARAHLSWAVEYTDPTRAAGYSPVTARWFETAACASVALGQPPASPTFGELFPYDGFVVALSPDSPEFERTLRTALAADDHPQRQALATHVREHHSWQQRCQTLLETALPH